MIDWIKYAGIIVGGTLLGAGYFNPSGTFLSFMMVWIFLIPVAAFAYLAYGLREHLKDRKQRIAVFIKPSEAMKALAYREAELKREKEILLRQLRNGINRD